MFANILKAEMYKQFSKISTYVVPIVVFLAFFISLFFLQRTISVAFVDYDETAFNLIAMFLLYLLIIILFFITLVILPIIISISIFGQDFNNNVIANTIASGISRNSIYWAKVFTIIVNYLIIFLTMTLGLLFATLLHQLFFQDSFIYDIAEEIDLEAVNIGLSYVLFNIFVSFWTFISVSIFAIIVTKNFVGAFFTVIGLNIGINILTSTVSTFIYAVEFNYDLVSLVSNIIQFAIILLLFVISYISFVKSEY